MRQKLKQGVAVVASGAACMGGGALLGNSVPEVNRHANDVYAEESTQHAEVSQSTLGHEGLVGGGLVWLLGIVGVAGFRAGRENIAAMER